MSEFVTKRIVAAQALVAKLRQRVDEGQGLVEYALKLGLSALLVTMALRYLGHDISNTLNNVAGAAPRMQTVTRVVTRVVYRTRTLVKVAPARVVVHVHTVPRTQTVTRVVTRVVYRTRTLVKMGSAPAGSAPNALSVALGGGGSADAYKQYSSGFTNHTLTFSLQLGSDFTMPRNDYLVLAQTIPITSSQVGKVDVILPADNRIRLDYFDSAGHRQVLGGRFVVPRGSWHTVELRETVGAGSGSLALLVDGISVSGGSKLYLGTQGLTGFAVGERFSPPGSGTAGHLYIDNVTTTSTRRDRMIVLSPAAANTPATTSAAASSTTG